MRVYIYILYIYSFHVFCCQADDTESPQLSSADTADPALSDGLQSLYKPEPLEELLNGDVFTHPELNAVIGRQDRLVPLFE